MNVFHVLSPDLNKILEKKGFIEPTLAQRMGIPEIYKGSDVLIIAPTGIGKTETAMLPVMDKIHVEKFPPVSALYITPLRSLNRNLLQRLYWWAENLGLEVGLRHGDTTKSERKFQVQHPPDIMITTPESLQGMIIGENIRKILSNVKFVIIDEIHEIVGSKRGIMLSVMLERLKEIAGNFQRIGLSATVGSQKRVAKFLSPNTKIIRAETHKDIRINLICPKPNKEDYEKADELMVLPETMAKIRKIYDLSRGHSTLIFTNTRQTAEVISSRLKRFDKEFKQDVHHGSLSKDVRIKTENDFKSGALKALVCTSSLELGIDIGSIDLVIQYQSPRQASKLIQRIGRSGHSINRVSEGVIISGGEDAFESYVIKERALSGKLEEIKIHEGALDVLVLSIMGISIENYKVSAKRIYSILKRSYAYRNLTYESFVDILNFMVSQHLIALEPNGDDFIVIRRRRGWKFYFENLSTIPDTYQYKIINIANRGYIGTLDEGFVSEYAQPGQTFIVKGLPWKIIQVEKDKVFVEPASSIEGAIPSWEGELIPVSFEVAQDVGALKEKIKRGKITPVCSDMKSLLEKEFATDKKILIEDYKDYVIIHAHFGSKVNETIARYISSIIISTHGRGVQLKVDPYRIIIKSASSKDEIEKILKSMTNMRDVVMDAVRNSSLFKWRFIHNARRMGLISKSADYRSINLSKIVSMYQFTPVYFETEREIEVDKLDIEKARKVAKMISDGEIKIKKIKGLTKFGELGLVHQFGEVIHPKDAKGEILKTIDNRLMRTRVRLMCMNCGRYSSIKYVKDVKDPECPVCKSRLIAVASPRDKKSFDVWKKKFSGKRLTKSEEKTFSNLERSSDLVIAYGQKAVKVLAGHGIGPETAARVLANLSDGSELIKDIVDAEKNFAKTHKYWKDNNRQ